MAASALTVQALTATVYDLVAAGASDMDSANADGNYFAYTGGGDYILVVNNANAVARTVTIVNQVGGSDLTFTATENDRGWMAAFSGTDFVDSNDRINFTYDAVTDLTVKVLKTPYGGTTSG